MYFPMTKALEEMPAERIEIGDLSGQGLNHYYIAAITLRGLAAFVPCALPEELAKNAVRFRTIISADLAIYDASVDRVTAHSQFKAVYFREARVKYVSKQ